MTNKEKERERPPPKSLPRFDMLSEMEPTVSLINEPPEKSPGVELRVIVGGKK
jgi:hypothetical protein